MLKYPKIKIIQRLGRLITTDHRCPIFYTKNTTRDSSREIFLERRISSLEFHKFCNSDGTTGISQKGTTFERFEVSKGGETHLVSVRSTVQQDAFVLKRRLVPSLQHWHWSSRCEADGNTSCVNELGISVSSR